MRILNLGLDYKYFDYIVLRLGKNRNTEGTSVDGLKAVNGLKKQFDTISQF